MGESFDINLEMTNNELVNYDEALQDNDEEKWIVVTKSEMKSIYSYKV